MAELMHHGRQPRTVTLRDERDRRDSRHLCAYLDETGRLHIDGQDLGPRTGLMSDGGEYEWFEVIAAEDVPRLLRWLGANEHDDILDVLDKSWSGARSYDLERRLEQSDIPIQRHSF
jgi:hypothetical protein